MSNLSESAKKYVKEDDLQELQDSLSAGTITTEDYEKNLIALAAEEILKDEVKENPDGYEIYFDYREKIDDDTFGEIFYDYCEMVQQAKESEASEITSFNQYLEEAINDRWSMWERESDTTEESFKYNRTSEELDIVNQYLENEEILLWEALEQAGFAGVSWELEDIIGDYHVNIMFATPSEQNYDMGSIPSMADMLIDPNLRGTPSDELDNALSYLVHQQGYEMSQVAEALGNDKPIDNTFLQSVVEEIENFPAYSMAELTALVTINSDNLDVLTQIANGEGTIELSSNTMIGLYNEWQGTGSSLEIDLDKELVIPADMVRGTQIETGIGESHRLYGGGWSVNGVYGLVGSAWEGSVKTTDEPSGREAIEKSMKENADTIIDMIEQNTDKRDMTD